MPDRALGPTWHAHRRPSELWCAGGAEFRDRAQTSKSPIPKSTIIEDSYNNWALQDSNLGPIGYEPTALTAELRALDGHNMPGLSASFKQELHLMRHQRP